MCYPVGCSKCGKTSWAGCGKHVAGVYEALSKDQVCLCKSWPGVELPAHMAAQIPADDDQGQVSPSCHIL